MKGAYVLSMPAAISQVPMPINFVIKPKLGEQVVSGKTLPAIKAYQLDTVDMPPSRYNEVRLDIAKFAKVPITRIALTKSNHAYVGIIDSDGVPLFFAINSKGMLTKPVKDQDAAWKAFDVMMDAERAGALKVRRAEAEREQVAFNINMSKALPKKDTSVAPVKKTKSKKASTKKTGKSGKTRYGYPQDKANNDKRKGKPGAAAKPASEQQKPTTDKKGQQRNTPDPVAVPEEPREKSADPQDLANQLQTPVQTIKQIAERFRDNKKLKGRKGFAKFMLVHLKDFVEKHKLDGDYFGLIYDALCGKGSTVAHKQ